MLLASVTDLRNSLGFDDDVTDFTLAATAALHAAEAALHNTLGTTFNRETRFDLFYVDEPGFRQGALSTTSFRLRKGLVASLGGTVYAGSVSDLTADPQTITNPFLDAEKGVVSDHETVYSRSFIKITYTAGFEVDATDKESYDLSQVPSWLQEVAKMHALLMLKSSPVLKQIQLELDADLIKSTLRAQTNQHVRYTPTAILPL